MLVRPSQYSNAFSPIDVTLSGIVMLSKHLHALNVHTSIVVIPSGMVMLPVRLRQLLNALLPIDATLAGILILVIFEQKENAPPSIVVTPVGIVILFSLQCQYLQVVLYQLLVC